MAAAVAAAERDGSTQKRQMRLNLIELDGENPSERERGRKGGESWLMNERQSIEQTLSRGGGPEYPAFRQNSGPFRHPGQRPSSSE